MLLPLVWWLARRTPPAPRVVRLPSILLLGPRDDAPPVRRRPPWWLLALRVAAVALLLGGLAGPSWRAVPVEPGAARVAIVIDNGWVAGEPWERLRAAARREIAALPDGARVALIGTAERGRGVDLVTPAAARAALDAMVPRAWAGDRVAAAGRLPPRAALVWIADGVEDAGAALRRRGGRVVIEPPAAPVIRAARRTPEGWRVALALPELARDDWELVARDAAGARLAGVRFGRGASDVALAVEPGAAPRVAMLALDRAEGAGARWLVDRSGERPRVALVDGERAEGAPPLERGGFYVRRALEPHAPVTAVTLDAAAAGAGELVVLVDVAVRRGAVADALLARARRGAVVVSFAGPRVAAAGSALAPAPLGAASRALGGALSWSAPQRVSGVAADGPLAGLGPLGAVSVRRQLLDRGGAPGVMRWAWLADGTPFVTARREGAGLLVLVHTAAGPGWSNLPLTGALEAMLARLLPLAANPGALRAAVNAPWVLASEMRGDGSLAPPGARRVIAAADWARAGVSERAPPGLWRAGGAVRARNLADGAMPPGFDFPPLATGGMRVGPSAGVPLALGPWLVGLALLLAAVDGLIAAGPAARRLLAGAAALGVLGAAGAGAAAQGQAAIEVAYVRSGDAATDAAARGGLEALARVLARRTAVKADAVRGVDPATERLGRYALIYWPVRRAPSAAQAVRARAYLARGGLILFDLGASGAALAELGLPPLEPLGRGHVLMRAFYQLRDPGGVWIEAGTRGANGRVAGAIVGRGGWAAAWAEADGAGPYEAREMALRFGVNLVIYALTGTYKADQVHAKALMERMRSEP